jgi:hypothetical protein
MQLFETIDRAKRMHSLIKREATGDPQRFADRLHLCRRQFFNVLSELKDLGAEIRYDRNRCTYFYTNDFDFQVIINLSPLNEKESKQVFGGFFSQKILQVQSYCTCVTDICNVIKRMVHNSGDRTLIL